MKDKVKGMIFNIQHYSLHDGPGIRTTVFFKGCPLKCWWCHNPESLDFNRQTVYNNEKCIGCKMCNQDENVDLQELKIENIDKCPTEALETVGSEYTVDMLMKEILKDQVFFEQSSGGVTFSGGEPLGQSEFLLQVLKECKERKLHIAVDTTGFVKWEKLEPLLEYIDLYLYDIKFVDNKAHKKYTGVSNQLILDNLKRLTDMDKRIFLRMPIIPGVNDEAQYIEEACEMISSLRVEQLNLLPYHNIAKGKYERLNEDYKLLELKEPSAERMIELKIKFESYGIKTFIGG